MVYKLNFKKVVEKMNADTTGRLKDKCQDCQ